MKSDLIIFLIDSAVLALLYICEFHGNKYADNFIVLGRTWGMLQMTIVWAASLSFASKVPSAQTVNNALHLTKKRGCLKTWIGRLGRLQDWLITVVSISFGQWMLAFSYGLFLLGIRVARHYAKDYLADVKVDEARRTATIDV